MAKLKGLIPEESDNNSKLILQYLEMTNLKDVQAGTLSEALKRKLSYAMSLLVWPKAQFMDMPFQFMSPTDMRGVKRLTKEIQSDSAVLLCTDSIDEAASICDNLAIMVNGKIICYGTPTYLSRAYGGSHEFTVTVNINNSDYLLAQTEIYE